MKRRELDGCPITGALQMLGDKWTMLIVRELLAGPKRTMELLNGLFPISSRTLVGRLRDMEKDRLVERTDFGGNPPHIEYALTERGMLLLPLLESLRQPTVNPALTTITRSGSRHHVARKTTQSFCYKPQMNADLRKSIYTDPISSVFGIMWPSGVMIAL
jgi:DNA-binding HxlR family transcriptional regulator